jgi:hypothetical protein
MSHNNGSMVQSLLTVKNTSPKIEKKS